MAHGGKRPGAGRRHGATSLRTREIAEAIIADPDLTPLEFLTRVYRDEGEDMARRVDAAKAAAQYVHPKLNSTEAKVTGNVSLRGVGPLLLQCNREASIDDAN